MSYTITTQLKQAILIVNNDLNVIKNKSHKLEIITDMKYKLDKLSKLIEDERDYLNALEREVIK